MKRTKAKRALRAPTLADLSTMLLDLRDLIDGQVRVAGALRGTAEMRPIVGQEHLLGVLAFALDSHLQELTKAQRLGEIIHNFSKKAEARQ